MKYPFRQRFITFGILIFTTFTLIGCKGNRPFEYLYTSPNEVEITYMGATYLISKNVELDEVPFDYDFEADGDVDITIDGVTYEIDSPYDLDGSLKKKKRRSSRRSRRR